MTEHPTQVWVFVFVRCTYTSDDRWKEFLASVEQQALEQLRVVKEILYATDFLQRTFRITTVEDEDKLGNATLVEASLAFQEWLRHDGAPILPEGGASRTPRWQYYIYVNEETVESVVNPRYSNQITGNFLVLVNLGVNLVEKHDEIFDPQDIPDESFKMVVVDGLVWHYILYAEEADHWYPVGNYWDGPPRIHGRGYDYRWWKSILREDDKARLGLMSIRC
jgi:hypothetical protein